MIFIRTKFSCLFFLLLLATPVLGQKIVIKARDLVTVSVGVAYPLGPSSVSDEATLLSNMNSGKVMRISYDPTFGGSSIWVLPEATPPSVAGIQIAVTYIINQQYHLHHSPLQSGSGVGHQKEVLEIN